MRHAVVSMVALGVALGVSSGVVHAQPAVENFQQNEARTHFQQGVQHYQAERYDQAIQEFLEAQRLFPSPVILFNLGQAYRAVGWLSDATVTFRRYLTEARGLTSAQRREVEGVIAEIEANRAVLAVDVEPAGATLTLDGRAVGTLPLPRDLELLPGEHTLSIRLENHEPREETLTLRRHQRRVFTATLRTVPLNARLVVDATPAEAAIRIDGQEVGTGRAAERVAPGAHTISVSLDGYHPASRTVTVGRLSSESVSLTLERRGRSIFTRPVFWGVVGGVVLVGLTVWIATHPADATPIGGNGTPSVVQSVVSW